MSLFRMKNSDTRVLSAQFPPKQLNAAASCEIGLVAANGEPFVVLTRPKTFITTAQLVTEP